MYWASRRPTAWIRSVVPIVWRTHGEVAAQSPARGWAPPTTTTDRAPGRRSSGRCFSGAWASNAVASAMPQTVAPDLRATDLSVAVALGARSDITGAGSVSSGRPRVARERRGPGSFGAGSVSSRRPRVAGERRGPASFVAGSVSPGRPRVAGDRAGRLHLSFRYLRPTGQTRMHSKHWAIESRKKPTD